MSGIFVSYRREDAAPYAGRIYDHLRIAFPASKVFMDIDAIDPGEDFVDAIDASLKESIVVVVIIGPRWAEVTDATGKCRIENPDDYVVRELRAALQNGTRVIPILVGGASMPRTEALLAELQPLTRRNALELSDSRFAADADRLVKAIAKFLTAGADPAQLADEVGAALPLPSATRSVSQHPSVNENPAVNTVKAVDQKIWQADLAEFDETFSGEDKPKCLVLIKFMLQALRKKGWDERDIGRVEFCVTELIENAFAHGINNVCTGKVRIRAVLTSDRCNCYVSDSGPGFSLAEQVAQRRGNVLGGGLVLVASVASLSQTDRNTLCLVVPSIHGRFPVTDTISKVGDIYTFKWNGRIDHATEPLFSNFLERFYQSEEVGVRVVFDFSGVDYISSIGLRAIMGFSKFIRSKSGRCVLLAPTITVAEIWQISRMYLVIPCVGTREEALTLLREPES